MNAVRYWLAVYVLTLVPPAFLFWFSIHPFVRFWRSVGPRLTLGIHFSGAAIAAGLIYWVRRPLLSMEFGTNFALIALAIPLLLAAELIRRRFSKHLRLWILVGLPELEPARHNIPLLTEGIYGRVRHPRYLQFFLSHAALALICNYLAIYILLAVLAAMMFPLVVIEERELRARFGAEYDAYCARVPRFIPKMRP